MKKNAMDIIMSLSLFMVFVICCFMLLLFQICGYHDLQYNADNLYTISSYLQTTIRQSDKIGAVQVQEIQQTPCLVIQYENGNRYVYIQDGVMQELYQDASLPVDLSLGEKRFQIDAWNISIKNQVFYADLIKEDQQIEVNLLLKSGGNS